jgi:uncharacterized membrane protein YdbT with pleckstrin-like domain
MDECSAPWFVEEDETIALAERPSWRYGVSLFLEMLVAIAVLGGLAYAGLRLLQPSLTGYIAPVGLVLAAGAAILAWRRCVTSLYVVTDKRLYAKRGRMLLRLHVASHDRVSDVRYDRGILDRALGVGNLTFATAGDNVSLPGVADAARIQREATRARDAFVEDLLERAGLDVRALEQAPTGTERLVSPEQPGAGAEPAEPSVRVDPERHGLAPYEGPGPDYVGSQETVRWLTKPTKLALVNSLGFVFVLLAFVTSAGIGNLVTRAQQLPIGPAAGAGALLVLGVLAWQWLRLDNTELAATDERVYLRRGIVATNVNQITYDKITDIAFNEGIAGRVLGYATLEINTSGSASKPISVDGITEALAVKRSIEEASEA